MMTMMESQRRKSLSVNTIHENSTRERNSSNVSPMNSPPSSNNSTNDGKPPAESPRTKERKNRPQIGELYWKQQDSNGWQLGQVTALHLEKQEDGEEVLGSVTFKLIDEATGEALDESEFPPIELDPRVNALYHANPLFSTAADMTSLRHLHDAALVKNLEDRSSLRNQRPYTFMANVLIAVNPLRYLEEPDKSLFMGKPLDRCPPHPYHIAESAYRQLCAVRAIMQNQSIIISGESGSGKTETSKIILDFLTTRAAHQQTASVSSFASEDESEPELTGSYLSNASTASNAPALSYPMSSVAHKLTPVALGERLMETIPILESFGNAKTHRNHNSSRFGKYMRLQFSTANHELAGASIDTYLLEKSRLVFQPTGERNFHIFYELLHSNRDQYLIDELKLKPKQPQEYFYLNQSGCMADELIDDSFNFRKLQKALRFVGIMDDAQNEIYRLVAGLLHLGNIHLEEIDTPEGRAAQVNEQDVDSKQALANAADMLGVSLEELVETMLMRRIMTRGSRRGSIYFVKRDLRNAVYSRDTIAKTIYEHLFTWLMIQCAISLDYDASRSDVIPYIGVLDIFGFEDFAPKNRNSFEQLLINYANEALQNLFNTCIFEAEQELYRSEHIFSPTNHSLSFPYPLPVSIVGELGSPKQQTDEHGVPISAENVHQHTELVQYADNRECLSLIASKHGGIFVTIDNVSRLPQPSDRKLNERFHTLFKRHPCFPAPHPKDIRDTFMVRHFAGTITYHIESFVDKNNNIISEQFEELIRNSSSRILREITGRNRLRSQESPTTKSNVLATTKRLKGGSVSNLFSSQMKGLTTELEGTSCNFVRCIKPNQQMKPGVFDKQFVWEQLRCSGTIQACEVLRVGLPTRILYAEVVDVYKHYLPKSMLQRFDYSEKLFTQAILWVYGFPTSAYRLGDSRLFFRTGKIDLLDKLLSPPTHQEKSTLATQMLLYLRKRRWISSVTKVIAYNRFVKIFQFCRYRSKAIIIQCMVRQHLARKRVRQVRVWHRISAAWNRMRHKTMVMNAYNNLPEDKMTLLDKLLKKNYLPKNQRWLLKWLGPLQRVIYLQKLWRKVLLQYLAKRGFLWLYAMVKRKRSVLMMQAHVRAMIAKSRLRRLKQKRIARERWRMAFVKVKCVAQFSRQLQRIHVVRLENDNSKLQLELARAKEQLALAQKQLSNLQEDYQEMACELKQTVIQRAEQEKRIEQMEDEMEITQLELQEFRHEASRSLFERAIRFFTCSNATASTIPLSPSERHHARKNRHRSQSWQPESSDLSPSSCSTSSSRLDDSDDSAGHGVLKHRNRQAQLEQEERAMNAKEKADPLWSVSRFCF